SPARVSTDRIKMYRGPLYRRPSALFINKYVLLLHTTDQSATATYKNKMELQNTANSGIPSDVLAKVRISSSRTCPRSKETVGTFRRARADRINTGKKLSNPTLTLLRKSRVDQIAQSSKLI